MQFILKIIKQKLKNKKKKVDDIKIGKWIIKL